MKPTEKLLLYVLLDYLQGKSECWPSIETLAAACSLQKRRISQLIAALTKREIVVSRRIRNETARRSINWARLNQETQPGALPERQETQSDSLRKRTGVQSGIALECASGSAMECAQKRPLNKPKERSKGTNQYRGKSSRFNAKDARIPESLDTPVFRDAWSNWCEYRSSKQIPVSKQACNEQLRNLKEVGPDEAVATIKRSIANDWQGLFPHKQPTSKKVDGADCNNHPTRVKGKLNEFKLSISNPA
ncbi:MAG: helix-turn-helix domain-containing protein [Planctomycetaceae bacterium]|nr:helix-turn-helix domain-containing protein [Planctomycetaceae bacterium]